MFGINQLLSARVGKRGVNFQRMAGNVDLHGKRLSDWEMARNWLLQEKVTRMSVKVRRQFLMHFYSIVWSIDTVAFSPISADRYQISLRSGQSMICTPT